MQNVAKGIMILIRPSVSQSWFLCQRNSSKTAQQNSAKHCVVKGMMCRCAYYKELLIHFLLGIMPLLNVEIWPKLNILLKQFVSAIPLKPLNRILWNFVVMKDKLCKCAYLQEIFIYMVFFPGATCMPLLNLEIWPKLKYTTKSVCNRNSSKLSHKISWNFVVDEDILCRCAYSQEILIWFFFSER